VSESAVSAVAAPAEDVDYSAAVQGITPGALGYLYGYEPVLVLGAEETGEIEIARFGSFEYVDGRDLNVGPRTAKPTHMLPVVPSPEDRVAGLEEQVRVLTDLLGQMARASGHGSLAPPEPAPAVAAPAGATPFEPPPAALVPAEPPSALAPDAPPAPAPEAPA
jgi:hypothetical protein